jgi:translation initiation factor 2B subunit (eIF-2B alpha/beta/delta family)
LENKEKGSSTLALEALRLIKRITRGDPGAAEKAFRLMGSWRPEMSVLKNVAESGSELLKQGLDSQRVCDALIEDLLRSIEVSVDGGLTLLKRGTSVLTLSNSEHVRSFLDRASGLLGKVYVLESRPGGEGAILLRRLVRRRIDAYLVADLNFQNVCERADCFITGCDAIGETFFVNKLGTKVVAQIFRQNRKKVYSLTTKWKVSSSPVHQTGCAHLLSKRGKRDITPIFESVPNSFVDMFVTDVGLLGPREVHAKLVDELKRFRPRPSEALE